MNEVFENLAEQAMVHVPGSTGLHTRAFSLEKFAELIVQECARVCLAQRDPANLNYKPSVKFAEAVKEHFGVEE
jgi:hypothetical protein